MEKTNGLSLNQHDYETHIIMLNNMIMVLTKQNAILANELTERRAAEKKEEV